MLDSIKRQWQDCLEERPRLEAFITRARCLIPPLNFITIHYAYFILGSLICSAIFWGSNERRGNIHYVDSLYLVVSAFTNTGLNSVNLSELTTWQQVLLWILFIVGSPIWVSFWTVMARKHAFEKRFDGIVEAEREGKKRRATMNTPAFRQFFSFNKFKSSPPVVDTLPGLGTRQTITEKPAPNPLLSNLVPMRRTVSAPEESISSDSGDNASRTTTLAPQPLADVNDHIAFVESMRRPHPSREGSSIYQRNDDLIDDRQSLDAASDASSEPNAIEDFLMHWKNILGDHNTSKRGQFYDLTSDEREALGGCEYRALKILAVTVPLYGFLWQGLCSLALGAWIARNKPAIAVEFGVNPWWAGIFLSVSAFNNTGMSVIDTNMVPFQSSYFVLIVVGVLVLAGNTAYPLFLRCILWSTLQIMKLTTTPATKAPWKETIEFILKYPRRVYTTLFPAGATWWLLLVLIAINTIDWLAFEILNIGNPVIEAMPISDRIIAGWFQAIGKLASAIKHIRFISVSHC